MQGAHDDNKSFDEEAEAAAAVVALSNLSPSSLRCQAGGATISTDVDARMSTVVNERNHRHQDIPSKKQQPVQCQGCGNESTTEQERQRRRREIENEMKPLPTLRHHFSRSKLLYNDQGSANSSSESSTHTTNSSFEMNRLSSGYEGSKSAGSSDSLSAGDSGNGNGGSKQCVEDKVGGQERCNNYHESDDLDEEYYSNTGKSVKFSIKPAHSRVTADYSKKKRQRMGDYDETETSGKESNLRGGEYRSLSSSSSSCSCSDDADDANVRTECVDNPIGGDCGPAVTFMRKGKLDQSLNDGVSSRQSFPSIPKLTPTNSVNGSSASYTGTTMSETVNSATSQFQSITAAKSSESSPIGANMSASLKAPEDEDEDEEMESADDPTNGFYGCKTGSPSLTSSGPGTKEPATENPSSLSETATIAKARTPSIESGSKITKSHSSRELRPAPYYYYIDHSRDRDEDPTSPLSQPLYAPNFAAKMHAILIREELSDIITWMPHGRSWKIVNPDEFEAKLLPVYFNHTKIASFYRQANGWGFRRMLKGSDKGSFYNENFLRGLPHLAKKMARTGGVKIVDDKKLDSNIAHEPNLWMISDEHPVPETVDQDTLSYAALKAINEIILEDGPKARMPVLPSKRYKSEYSSSRVTTRQLEQVGDKSDRKQSSESSLKGSLNEHGTSSHLLTINSAVQTMSAKQLPPTSQRINTCLSLAQQQRHDDPTRELNPQILMSQQPHQKPQEYNQYKNVNQNQQQVAWNNISQESIMAFISSQISANATQQQQQLPNLANIFLNSSLINAGPSVIQGLDIFSRSQQSQHQQHQKQPSPQQQRYPDAFAQQPINNSANHVVQLPPCNVSSNNNAGNDFLNPILAVWQQQQLLQQQQQRQQQPVSSDPSSATASLASSASTGRRRHVNPAPHPSRQRHSPAHLPSEIELERLLNSILEEHQQRGQQQMHQQQREQQRQQVDKANGVMSASAVRELVAQAIILGAQFGAESVMNQNGSSSSESNGNLDVSSDTA